MKEISQVVQTTLDLLTPLLGVWIGRGKGGYPTLDAFEYAETFRVYEIASASFLAYEQNTELIDLDGRPVRTSHWESGILRPLEDGSVELACVQGGGRLEVLRGTGLNKESHPNLMFLQFQSRLIGNDERVKSTRREWFLTDNRRRYFMTMATSRVDVPSLHLEASLFRS